MLSPLNPLTLRGSGPILAGSTNTPLRKPSNKTTQWAVASTRYPMRKHFKSRFPAFNIPRRSEEVATDTIFSDTPAIDSGVTMAQIVFGKRTLVTDVYPLKSHNLPSLFHKTSLLKQFVLPSLPKLSNTSHRNNRHISPIFSLELEGSQRVMK